MRRLLKMIISTQIMSNESILKRVNYTQDIVFYNGIIYEYDIAKCNISVLIEDNIITLKTYNMLLKSEKMFREIFVTNRIIKKRKEIFKMMKERIIKNRIKFVTQNNIGEFDILSLKNDAIFVTQYCPKTKTSKFIEFVNKNEYSMFIKILNYEIYYNVNTDHIDVKGISDIKLKSHNNGFLEVVRGVCYLININKYFDALKLIENVYKGYMEHSNDLLLYRNFDAHSVFVSKTYDGFTFGVPIVTERSDLIISHNIKFLMEFSKIIYQYILKN